MMNSTLTLLMTSLMMGTSFLQKIAPEEVKAAKTEARSYGGNHPLLVRPGLIGGGVDSSEGGCWESSPHKHGLEEQDHKLIDGYPFGKPPLGSIAPGSLYPGVIPGRGNQNGFSRGQQLDNCKVRIGLHYYSCFSKYEDFDDKLVELRRHVPSLPRGAEGLHSPCETLQLLSKVKSSPMFDRCHGNQYILRTPFHMYNIKGELRYIVQDSPHLEQCYLEAACNIPTQLCTNVGYPPERRPSGCESRQCHHTLLSWDPSNPNLGTFFDTFEYSCCCNCHVLQLPGRSQVIG